MVKWQSKLFKRNGDKRRQYSSWTIPKNLREELKINDGMMIKINIHPINDPRKYRVTSGGEIRLPNDLANSVESLANTRQTIEFSIMGSGEIDDSFEERVKSSINDDREKREKRLKNASKNPATYHVMVSVYERNPWSKSRIGTILDQTDSGQPR